MAALHVCATPISERGQYTTLLDSTGGHGQDRPYKLRPARLKASDALLVVGDSFQLFVDDGEGSAYFYLPRVDVKQRHLSG